MAGTGKQISLAEVQAELCSAPLAAPRASPRCRSETSKHGEQMIIRVSKARATSCPGREQLGFRGVP